MLSPTPEAYKALYGVLLGDLEAWARGGSWRTRSGGLSTLTLTSHSPLPRVVSSPGRCMGNLDSRENLVSIRSLGVFGPGPQSRVWTKCRVCDREVEAREYEDRSNSSQSKEKWAIQL